MRITFDPKKREVTLRERKLDVVDAVEVFAGRRFETPDLRFDYPEPRHTTYGLLRGRMVVVIWTPTDDGRRIISMRKANERERKALGQRLGVH
jgi:uncharacterized protein